MKKLFISTTVISALVLLSCKGDTKNTNTETVTNKSKEEICFYEVNPEKTKVRWTAFKTSEKVGVAGEFKQANVSGGEKSTKLTDAISSIKFNIPTSSTNTENPERDQKIVESFFNTMEGGDLIIGMVNKVEGDNSVGKCTFFLTMNNIEKEVVLDYTLQENILTLKGTIDVANWNGNDAIAALNEVCSDLHKGEDGESVLWSEVDIEVECELNISCE